MSTPVLLVHGYLGTVSPFAPLAARLYQEGYDGVFAFRYDTLTWGVPEVAARLAEAVHGLLARTAADGVHLVGHSLGGIVVRYAVQVSGLDRVARSVVTVATPHQGSSLAWLGAGPAAAQLRPGSALLDGLPPLDRTGLVHWLDVRAAADVIVRGPGDGLVLAGEGHHSVLACDALAEAVVRHFAAAGTRAPVPAPAPAPVAAALPGTAA